MMNRVGSILTESELREILEDYHGLPNTALNRAAIVRHIRHACINKLAKLNPPRTCGQLDMRPIIDALMPRK